MGFRNVELEFCLSLVRAVPGSVSALVLFGMSAAEKVSAGVGVFLGG